MSFGNLFLVNVLVYHITAIIKQPVLLIHVKRPKLVDVKNNIFGFFILGYINELHTNIKLPLTISIGGILGGIKRREWFIISSAQIAHWIMPRSRPSRIKGDFLWSAVVDLR